MEIYTDGSHTRKPRISGVGVVILDRGKEFRVGAFSNKCLDNNVAEIMGVAFAIKYICDKHIVDKTRSKNITIFTDSEYVIHKLRYNTPPKDEFEESMIDYIQDFMYNTRKKVTMFQIKGHVHDGTKISFYNNLADKIAKYYRLIGLRKYKELMIQKSIKNKQY